MKRTYIVKHFFLSTTTRQSYGRYLVHLPFKENFPNETHLCHSMSSALLNIIGCKSSWKIF